MIIPLLWFMRASSKSLAVWLNIDLPGDENIEGSVVDRTFYVVLMLSGTLILLIRRIEWYRLIKSNSVIFLLFTYMGISILWSGYPAISFRRWMHTAGDLVMILVIITEYNPDDSLAKMSRILSLLLLFISILLIKYVRYLGVQWDYSGQVEMWTGVATHKNTLGQLSLFAGLYCVWDFLRKKSGLFHKVIIAFIFSMVVYTLHGSNDSLSATSLVVYIVGSLILLLLFSFRFYSRKMITPIMVLLFLTGGFSFYSQISEQSGGLFTLVAGSVGRDQNLTGRTDLWNELIRIGSENQPAGVGYGSFWIGDISNNLWQKFTWRPEQGHNGYIDIYVELGVLGLALLLVLIFKAVKDIRNMLKYDFSYGVLRFTLLVVCLMHNLTESSFGRPSHLMWLLFLLSVSNISDYK